MPTLQDHMGNDYEALTDHYGVSQYFAPNGEVVAVPLYKLVGDSFGVAMLDPNLWTASTGTGGTVDDTGGVARMITGTTANNVTTLTSVRTARYSGLAANKLRVIVQLPDSGVANNIRRGGIFTTNDGAFFELNGTTFRCVLRKAGVDTIVENGTFNGQLGTTFKMDNGSHVYEIIYQPRQVMFLADQKIIHTYSAMMVPWSSILHLPIRFENYNINGSTTNVTMYLRMATVGRFGIPETQPTYKYISGAVTSILKYGPGNLHGVTINSNTGTRIILYDGLDASGAVIASINPNQLTTLDYKNLTFSTGLTVVSTGGTVDCTIMYE